MRSEAINLFDLFFLLIFLLILTIVLIKITPGSEV